MSRKREIPYRYARKNSARRPPSKRLKPSPESGPTRRRSASWVSHRGSSRKTTAPRPRPTAMEPAIAQPEPAAVAGIAGDAPVAAAAGDAALAAFAADSSPGDASPGDASPGDATPGDPSAVAIACSAEKLR